KQSGEQNCSDKSKLPISLTCEPSKTVAISKLRCYCRGRSSPNPGEGMSVAAQIGPEQGAPVRPQPGRSLHVRRRRTPDAEARHAHAKRLLRDYHRRGDLAARDRLVPPVLPVPPQTAR